MSDILLAKSSLDADVIDAAVGEAHIVRDTFLSIFDVSGFDLPPTNKIWEYQEPQGYKPLIKLLEDRYQAPIIICNGAKQGLGSCFYALKQLGKCNLGVKFPYWALIPPLMEMHGLSFQSNDLSKINCYLDVSPNNPDGHMSDLKTLSEVLKESNIPFVHDAAYYTHTYLPDSYNLDVFGDAQIYSISKMFGFSSLRLGFVICKNPEFYRLIKYYIETMTVGVSILSQIFLYNLLNMMHEFPILTKKFEQESFDAIKKSKNIFKQINSDILEVTDNLEDVIGMFAFCKTKDISLFKKVKVNVIDGKHFGAPNYVRINLALPESQIKEIVKRINFIKDV